MGDLGTIFINYRKQDSEWKTETFYKELLNHFDQNSIFKDFTTIEPGEDFTVAINNGLNNCNVFLVIIGKDWLDIKNSAGKRRLDDPVDFVRIEIATALKRGIRVIPVLFDNIEMPLKETLPEDLQALCNRQAISVDKVNLVSDVERLAEVITKEFVSPVYARPIPIPGPVPPKPSLFFSKINMILFALVGIIILVSTILFFAGIQKGKYVFQYYLLCYLLVLLTGILSIIVQLGKTRLPKKTLLAICSFLLLTIIALIFIFMHFPIVSLFLLLIIAALIILLVWKEIFIAAQVIVLIVFAVFTTFLIDGFSKPNNRFIKYTPKDSNDHELKEPATDSTKHKKDTLTKVFDNEGH